MRREGRVAPPNWGVWIRQRRREEREKGKKGRLGWGVQGLLFSTLSTGQSSTRGTPPKCGVAFLSRKPAISLKGDKDRSYH